MVDDNQVLAWQQQAFAGDATASFNLGVHFNLDGYVDDAIQYYVDSAEAGNHEAMAYLAWAHKMRGDLTQARAWGRKAVAAGNPHAEELLTAMQAVLDPSTARTVCTAAKIDGAH